MPTAAIENRILDQLLIELAKIGDVPANWNSTPYTVLEGVPADSVPVLDKPRLYVQFVNTTPGGSSVMTTASHRWRSQYNVWIVAKTMRDCCTVKSDVLRAIYAAEGTFASMFTQPMYPTGFSLNDSTVSSGMWIGVQQLIIDYETTHSTP